MNPTTYLASHLSDASQSSSQDALARLTSMPISSLPDSRSSPPREELRHILLGSPDAIRQTIHQLHTLSYVESVLWSPIIAVGGQVIITPAQGEAMSLLRRSL